MSNKEYETLISQIVSSGRGWDAIKDIARILEHESIDREIETREFAAEKRAIKRFCNSKQTPKQKVDAIKSIVE